MNKLDKFIACRRMRLDVTKENCGGVRCNNCEYYFIGCEYVKLSTKLVYKIIDRQNGFNKFSGKLGSTILFNNLVVGLDGIPYYTNTGKYIGYLQRGYNGNDKYITPKGEVVDTYNEL